MSQYNIDTLLAVGAVASAYLAVTLGAFVFDHLGRCANCRRWCWLREWMYCRTCRALAAIHDA